MIHHIVMWKLKDQCGQPGSPERQQAARRIKAALEDLVPVVPSLGGLEVGINCLNPQANHDLVLTTWFATPADLQAYQDHPEHKKVGALVRELAETRACVDWED